MFTRGFRINSHEHKLFNYSPSQSSKYLTQQNFENISVLQQIMKIAEFLQKERKPCLLPDWLDNWSKSSSFDVDAFFSGDVVFYPGGGSDGQPIRLFNEGCNVSCFLYADSGQDLEVVDEEFSERPLKGYILINAGEVLFDQVFKESIGQTVIFRGLRGECVYDAKDKIGRLYIFQHDGSEVSEKCSPFLVILYLNIDAFYAFDSLFSEEKPPFAILLADHGCGGNWDVFGRNGILEETSMTRRIIPKWLLVAENTREWRMYRKVPNVKGDIGGVHKNLRRLFAYIE